MTEYAEYKVVVNDEEQYSIWPADRENAPGWQDAGPRGQKSVCLGWIEANWTDMRPLSLRRLAERPPQPGNTPTPTGDTPT